MTSFDCVDCGVDTNNEYYMILDDIWEAFGAGDGMLCVGCLEHRIGRELDVSDFTNCPLNVIDMGWHKSERLLDRLSA